eukprot:COSAG02_NODE_3612_length_6484_cov_22.155834_7_plen_161_part_01
MGTFCANLLAGCCVGRGGTSTRPRINSLWVYSCTRVQIGLQHMLASAPRLVFPDAARCAQLLLWICVLADSAAGTPARGKRDSLLATVNPLRQLQGQPAYNCSSADDDEDPTTTVACCECEVACSICGDYYSEAGCIDGGCVWDAQGGYCGANETCVDNCS